MIFLFHCMIVGFFHPLGSGNGADQHEQGRFGQMKVGYQHIKNFELIARRDKNAGVVGKRMNNSLIVGSTFKQAQRGCADGDNAFAGFFLPH